MNDFKYTHRVHFYETDMMGVVHHSNYLRVFEEARMAWMRHKKLHTTHAPHTEISLAVLETSCQHHRPAHLDDILTVYLQVKREGARVRFAYALYSDRYDALVAKGTSTHIPMNRELKACRLPKQIIKQLESEPWNETWPSNL